MKTKTLVIIVVVLVVVVVVGYALINSMSRRLSEEDLKELALAKAKEALVKDIYIEKMNIPMLNEFFSGYSTFRVSGQPKEAISYPYPSTYVIAVSPNRVAFIIPPDFTTMVQKQHIKIDDKDKAINLASLYLYFLDNTTIILENASDIPWKQRPTYAVDPLNYSTIIKPPNIFLDYDVYSINIYTWHKNGDVIKWSFEIKKDGQLSVEKNKIASKVGDYSLSGFR